MYFNLNESEDCGSMCSLNRKDKEIIVEVYDILYLLNKGRYILNPRKITIKTKDKKIKSITIDAKHQREIDNKVKESYPLKNDTFMLFAQHKNFCQEFLRVILQDKKLVVLENDIQNHI